MIFSYNKEHEEKGERNVEAHLCLVCWRTQTSKDRHEDHMVRYHRDSEKTKVGICQRDTGISCKEKH